MSPAARRASALGGALVIVCVVCILAWRSLHDAGPAPRPLERALAVGVRYTREVITSPRPNVLHWVEIDLSTDPDFVVTPAHPGGGSIARTASEAAIELDADVVINTNFFLYPQREWLPWHQHPASGEHVACLGLASSGGARLCDEPWEEQASLFLPTGTRPTFASEPTAPDIISGRRFLVREGRVVADAEPEPYPRAAIGLDRAAQRMTWLVVDGHAPGTREGLGLAELAELLVERGAWTAIELDGGGSAELVGRDAHGAVEILSMPTQREVPGWERPVAVHLGVRAADARP